MRKIAAPIVDPIDVYNACVDEVSDENLRLIYKAHQAHIVQASASFSAATQNTSWATLVRVPRGNPDRIVVGGLTKKQLTDLYSSYMVDSSGPSRKIYDDLLVAAGGKCPFCGGVGQVYTLDHYLPKSNFPLYSVYPVNLVPCCRDCNTGKGTNFANSVDRQALHPYLDDSKFYDERWVKAELRKTNPVVLEYVCSAPDHWTHNEKSRVQEHFRSYKFAYRYSIQAGAELARVIDSRRGALSILPSDVFREYLAENADSKDYDLNGWSRAMYAALADSDWFCDTDFQNPNWHLF